MEEEIIGGSFRIDVSQLRTDLKKANKYISESNAEFQKATAGVDDWQDSTVGLAAKMKNLTEVIGLQEKKVSALKENYQKLVDEGANETTNKMINLRKEIALETASLENNKAALIRTTAAYNDSERKLEEVGKEISVLTKEYKTLTAEQGKGSNEAEKLKAKIDSLKDEYDDLAKEVLEAKKANGELDNSNEKLKEGFTVVKGVIANLITDGIKKLATSMVEAAREVYNAGATFESAFAGVRKTVEGTDEELETIRQGIRDMSKELPASANEIAAVAEVAGQLGIATEDILKFTKVMIDLGESTNVSAGEGAEQLARFASIMGTSGDNFDRLGAALVELGNNYATTEADILSMSMRLAGAGKQVGLSEAEVFGFATALSSVGINFCPAY